MLITSETNDAGFLDVALLCARDYAAEPATLVRAAPDFAANEPKFAAQTSAGSVAQRFWVQSSPQEVGASWSEAYGRSATEALELNYPRAVPTVRIRLPPAVSLLRTRN